MMLAIALLSACAACASAPGGETVGGVATYDNLKAARTACQSRGEALVLRSQGDPQRMSAYECKRN